MPKQGKRKGNGHTGRFVQSGDCTGVVDLKVLGKKEDLKKNKLRTPLDSKSHPAVPVVLC